MEIIQVIIVFYPDSSVGIRCEEFRMDLPCYTHDQVEIEEISEQIRAVYEPFCETKMTLHFVCKDGSVVDEKGVYLPQEEALDHTKYGADGMAMLYGIDV